MNYLYFKKEDGEHLKIKLIDSCREDMVLIKNILQRVEKESQCLLNSNLMVHRYRTRIRKRKQCMTSTDKEKVDGSFN